MPTITRWAAEHLAAGEVDLEEPALRASRARRGPGGARCRAASVSSRSSSTRPSLTEERSGELQLARPGVMSVG